VEELSAGIDLRTIALSLDQTSVWGRARAHKSLKKLSKSHAFVKVCNAPIDSQAASSRSLRFRIFTGRNVFDSARALQNSGCQLTLGRPVPTSVPKIHD